MCGGARGGPRLVLRPAECPACEEKVECGACAAVRGGEGEHVMEGARGGSHVGEGARGEEIGRAHV